MTLPKINQNPTYTFELPSTHQKLRFRPFLVKENKALIIAQSTEDLSVMVETLRGIIQSTCLDSDLLDVDQLTSYDFEYLLIKLRSISVDQKIELDVVCPHCKTHHNVILDLNDVEVVNNDKFTNFISISDDCVVEMKLPTLNELKQHVANDGATVLEKNIKMVANQIKSIYFRDELYDFSESSEQDVLEWIENLNETQLVKLLDYFNNIPYCRFKVSWVCPKCGLSNTRHIEGIDYFF